ncbi:MAG: hypothetical protein RIS60_2218 [Pseudomonadota bacterium]
MCLKAENYRHSAFIVGMLDGAPPGPGGAAGGVLSGVAMLYSGRDIVCVRRQFAVGGHPFDCSRRARLGYLGHRILCQLALHGFQFASASLLDAPAPL